MTDFFSTRNDDPVKASDGVALDLGSKKQL